MPTLILSTLSLPAERTLANAAHALGWETHAFDENPTIAPVGKVVYYGGVDRVLEVAKRFDIALIEPPWDLLSTLPREFVLRSIQFGRFRDLDRLTKPTFVKPADSLNKVFDTGVYSSIRDIRASKTVTPETPILVSEPVEWLSEFRCFILDGKLTAWSPYISYGRTAWKPFDSSRPALALPAVLSYFCARLFTRAKIAFPPAFVVDIGQIDELGWAVVEFNPVWCSGLLGADPRKVLAVLERSCIDKASLGEEDRRWIVR